MENSTGNLELLKEQAILKEFFRARPKSNKNSIAVKCFKSLEKNSFSKSRRRIKFIFYIAIMIISIVLTIIPAIVELMPKASFSSIPMVVTFYFSVFLFLFMLIFPDFIIKGIYIKWMRIITIIQFALFIISSFYLSFSRNFECLTFYHVIAFVAFMLIPFAISERFLDSDAPYFKNYILLSANSFMLFGTVFTSVFQYLRLAHPDYTGGKLQGIMWLVLGGAVVLYYIGFGTFLLTCYLKERKGKM